MPIIPKVGRNRFEYRLLIGVIYTVLSLGGITMVYPFLLMLATSITGPTDYNEFRVVPRYLKDDEALFVKLIDEKYAGDLDLVNAMYQTQFTKLTKATLPSPQAIDRNAKVLTLWRAFEKSVKLRYRVLGFRGYGTHTGRILNLYQAHLRQRFQNDITKLNAEFTEENENFERVSVPQERPNKRSWAPDNSPKMIDFGEWKRSLPLNMTPVCSADTLFGLYLKEESAYAGNLSKVKEVWGNASGYGDIPLAESIDKLDARYPKRKQDWESFVRNKAPFRYIRFLPEALIPYRHFLSKKYHNTQKYRDMGGPALASFNNARFPENVPDSGPENVDFGEFLKIAPIETIQLDTPDISFRKYCEAHGFSSLSAASVHIPYYFADADYVIKNGSSERLQYVGRNYGQVLDYILLHGRSLYVTAIFCFLVVAVTLIVNPLCAYALSRYKLRAGNAILLFLLATMAFPAEVAMIPNFLLLKQLGMLNTFWALVLPGAANGFSIFLLKGFFDSLPRELFEAGNIDGASEARLFFNLTIPMAKPIFAVIALQAFMGAYGAFMFALVVCQNPRMWTIMVWLYELQTDHPIYITMAGLTVAAVPTFLIFLFAQNVIMRGIILPQEK